MSGLPEGGRPSGTDPRGADADAALRESETHYRYMVELYPQVPWTADPDGGVLDVGQSWLALTGLTREQTVGDGWTRALHPDDLPRVTSAWRRSVESGDPYDAEYRTRLADGGYRWVRARALSRRDDRGRVLRWYGFTEDVHDRRVAEDLLRASEERFRLVAETLAGFVYDVDLSTGRVAFYRGIDGVLGFEPDEAPADLTAWRDLVHPDDVARGPGAWQAAVDGDAPGYVIEFRIRHRDGHWADVVDYGRIVRDGTGRAVRVLGGTSDVSERRRLERERDRLLKGVQRERARLAEVFDRAPNFLAVLRGPDHVIELANAAFTDIFGTRALVGRPAFDAIPEMRERFRPLLDQVLATGEPFVGREIPAHLTLVPDAAPVERFFDFAYVPFVEVDGTRSGVIAHGTDVTAHVLARREVERLLAESEGLRAKAERAAGLEREARTAAEASARSRDEVLAVVSHDLRTPVATIAMAAQALVDGAEASLPSASTAGLITAIKLAAESMSRQVRDLLDVASIEAGRLAISARAEDPAGLVADVAALFALAAFEAGVVLDTRVAPDLPAVRADAERLEQALANLVTNALRFTAPGGRITLVAARDPEGVRFSVEDTGSGIVPEDLANLFDRFWQRRRSGQRGGTGLGLSIVRGIVEAHGGRLAVDSVPGRGSGFSFAIPATDHPP